MIADVNCAVMPAPAAAAPRSKCVAGRGDSTSFDALVEEAGVQEARGGTRTRRLHADGARPVPEAAGRGVKAAEAIPAASLWLAGLSSIAPPEAQYEASARTGEALEDATQADQADDELSFEGVVDIDWPLAQPVPRLPRWKESASADPSGPVGESAPGWLDAAVPGGTDMAPEIELPIEPAGASAGRPAAGESSVLKADSTTHQAQVEREERAADFRRVGAPNASDADRDVELLSQSVAGSGDDQQQQPAGDFREAAQRTERGRAQKAADRIMPVSDSDAGGPTESKLVDAAPVGHQNPFDIGTARQDHAADRARTEAASAPAGASFALHAASERQPQVEAAIRAFQAAVSPEADIPQADSVHDLVQTMRLQFRDGIGDAVVRLKPEHLGEVSISLRVTQQSVSATVQADTASVRHWLETQESSLRNGLAGHGLHLESFVVRKDGEERRNREAPDDESRRRHRRAARMRGEDSEARFEIVA